MPLSAALHAFVESRYAGLIARCREAHVALYDDAGVDEHLQRVILASDFAWDALLREPEMLGRGLGELISDPRPADARVPRMASGVAETDMMALLRHYRRREALRLIWRDVNGLDAIEQTLAGASALAEVCLALALEFAENALIHRHGQPRNPDGQAQRLVVMAFGKLGGAELNFSSDIDLILAFPDNGQTDGERPLANELFFARVGQQLVKLLAEITQDGYVFRVDLRLRPFGSAGRVALSFAAMEQYYQREGRDWERYAWIKARPVAGDIVAGKRLIDLMRPFVYRRYLDYTAFAGLREMKALIDAEVARKDLAQHLKLGPGGIREIEFIVQLLQLIRGGREPSLRERGLLPALAACERLGVLASTGAKRLRTAYRLLRRVENRVQMLRDEQTHDLPNDEFTRERLARALDYVDWSALDLEIARARAAVAAEFAALMTPLPGHEIASKQESAAEILWRKLLAGEGDSTALTAMGFQRVATLQAQLAGLKSSPTLRTLPERTTARLHRLIPAFIESAARTVAPDDCLERLLRLVQAVLRRSAYLALLEEQPRARGRLVELFADSALLAERVIAHPLLLDDLFDARVEPGDDNDLIVELDRRLQHVEAGDAEAEIEILQEEKQSAAFRVGLAHRRGSSDAIASARNLSSIAEVVVARVLVLAQRDNIRQHGRLAGAGGLAVIGYGSLGGRELGFTSDLDLVFVYDAADAVGESDGARTLEGVRYFARIAQRVVHWLTTQTHAGRLYDVDVRLRPDGGKGLLVVSLEAFAEYQRERAWVWEQQALVRARGIAGDASVIARFAKIRRGLLARERDPAVVREQVMSMRARWRAERDRSTETLLDLKQGAGALLDIEFLLQALVLLHAHRQPKVLESASSAELIGALAAAQVLDAQSALVLSEAHVAFVARGLACTLDGRPRLIARDAQLAAYADCVRDVCASAGLDFA